MHEAHDVEDGERRAREVGENQQEEQACADEEHAAAADEVNEAAGRDAGKECADDEEAGREPRHAEAGTEMLHRICGRPEHQEEVDAVDEQIDRDRKEIIAVPETWLRSSLFRSHRGRLLSRNENTCG